MLKSSDSFIYTVSNNSRETTDETFGNDDSGNSEPAIANDDTFNIEANTAAVLDVLANDSDADGDEIIITDFIQPENGTVELNSDGTLIYTPNQDFVGDDSFSYGVSDGRGETTDETGVTLIVGAENTSTSINDDTLIADTGTTMALTIAMVAFAVKHMLIPL